MNLFMLTRWDSAFETKSICDQTFSSEINSQFRFSKTILKRVKTI
jgi:hypothetical protein